MVQENDSSDNTAPKVMTSSSLESYNIIRTEGEAILFSERALFEGSQGPLPACDFAVACVIPEDCRTVRSNINSPSPSAFVAQIEGPTGAASVLILCEQGKLIILSENTFLPKATYYRIQENKISKGK